MSAVFVSRKIDVVDGKRRIWKALTEELRNNEESCCPFLGEQGLRSPPAEAPSGLAADPRTHREM